MSLRKIKNNRLTKVFKELRKAKNKDIFFSNEIDKNIYLAKDIEEKPILLISMNNENFLTPVTLVNVEIRHNVFCQIVEKNNRKIEGKFSYIRCTASDEGLIEYFLFIMNSNLEIFTKVKTEKEIQDIFNHLVTLFKKINQPSIKKIQGFWSELFLIQNSKKIKDMLNAWHINPKDHFDFDFGTNKIEVKSFSGDMRKHHFSYEQVYPFQNSSVFIASIYAKESDRGVSLKDLWLKIRFEIKDDLGLIFKFEEKCANSLGSDLQNSLHLSFDYEMAKENLKFFHIKDIPKIQKAIPKNVSHIRFMSNIDENLSSKDNFIENLFEVNK